MSASRAPGLADPLGAPRERAGATSRRAARPYTNPYVAGIGIGVVLLLAFVIMGRGLGASGAFSSLVATGVSAVDAEHAAGSVPYAAYLRDGVRSPLRDWLVFEILGVTLGGFASAWLFGRFRPRIEKGPRVSSRTRLWLAFGGGTLMGIGAKFARGCTSGQALTGGALLSAGSWLFIAGAFAAAYLAAPLFRKEWR